jgi:hypothetical protein
MMIIVIMMAILTTSTARPIARMMITINFIMILIICNVQLAAPVLNKNHPNKKISGDYVRYKNMITCKIL